ncbi:hypothetical protein B0H34DRAFT_650411 [Crassisporium funariophilum]|nr:hypothetical protein B0H34DRAFT_650411 [Crassisporium funariophilum]
MVFDFDSYHAVTLSDTSDLATFAARNPLLPVQPARIHSESKLSDAQKASQALRRQATKTKREQLVSDLEDALAQHDVNLDTIAKVHSVTRGHLDSLISTSSHFKKGNAVNLENAKLRAKAKEVNEGLDVGYKHKLPAIRRLLKEDSTYADENLSEERRKELIADVEADRAEKKQGARVTNKSAAQDYRDTVNLISQEIHKLECRTGATALAFFSRSHVNDTYEPNWACTNNVTTFSRDMLGHGMWDITRLLEMWVCSKKQGRNADAPPTMRTDCSSILQGTLRTITKEKTAVMAYEKYEIDIMQKYKVKLVGWTFGTKIVSPYNIHSVGDLRTLTEALRSGSCRWVNMSPLEATKHAADYERRKADGEVVEKKRKRRSDADTVKGPRKKPGINDTANEEGEAVAGPLKKRKTTATRTASGEKQATKAAPAKVTKSTKKSAMPPRGPISNEFIMDSEADSA